MQQLSLADQKKKQREYSRMHLFPNKHFIKEILPTKMTQRGLGILMIWSESWIFNNAILPRQWWEKTHIHSVCVNINDCVTAAGWF